MFVAGAFLAPALLIGMGLALGRRWIEPTCPSCHHKSWQQTTAALVCTECGFSTLPPQPAAESMAA